MTANSKTGLTGWAQLAMCMGLIAVVWLGILPAIGRIPSVQQRHEWLEAEGIDASAMFYTELDIPATTIAEDKPQRRPAP